MGSLTPLLPSGASCSSRAGDSPELVYEAGSVLTVRNGGEQPECKSGQDDADRGGPEDVGCGDPDAERRDGAVRQVTDSAGHGTTRPRSPISSDVVAAS